MATLKNLEHIQKDIEILKKESVLTKSKILDLHLLLEKERTLLNIKLYEYNLTIQEQKKKIYQLQKELDEEKICHYLTKKLCIFSTKLKN